MGRVRVLLLVLASVVLGFTSCLLDSDEEVFGISGHIRDGAGQPVDDVLIRRTGSESGSTYTRSDGYYWLPVGWRSDEIALVPVKSGWAFCPGRIELTDAAGCNHTQDFTGFFGGDVVIEGMVSDAAGNPAEGVKVINVEPGIMKGLTSVTNYLGYYRFNNVIAGYKYRFRPDKPGCAFVPAERVYDLPAHDYLLQNFTVSCVETFGLSGRVLDLDGNAVAGVTLRFMPDDVTAVTAADGRYDRDGLTPSDHVEVTPFKEGCVFEPTRRAVSAPAGDETGVDFVAYCGDKYAVSGHVTADNDVALPDIALRLTGGCCLQSRTALTDRTGRYEFVGLPGGFDYVIRPESGGLRVQPDSIMIYDLGRDYSGQDFAFSSEQTFYSVSGRVTDCNSIPFAGVIVEFDYLTPLGEEPGFLAGGRRESSVASVVTDEEGRFSLSVPGGLTLEFYPSAEACYFIPYARWCPGDMDHESQNFVAHCGDGHAVSGYIKDIYGRPVAGLEVGASGAGYFPPPLTYTDTLGYYELDDLPNGLEVTVRPSVDFSILYEGCIFCPPDRVYEDIDEDYSLQNYTLSCPQP
jgi:protocatechuate 3,4-dioxygenase beta subunit